MENGKWPSLIYTKVYVITVGKCDNGIFTCICGDLMLVIGLK